MKRGGGNNRPRAHTVCPVRNTQRGYHKPGSTESSKGVRRAVSLVLDENFQPILRPSRAVVLPLWGVIHRRPPILVSEIRPYVSMTDNNPLCHTNLRHRAPLFFVSQRVLHGSVVPTKLYLVPGKKKQRSAGSSKQQQQNSECCLMGWVRRLEYWVYAKNGAIVHNPAKSCGVVSSREKSSNQPAGAKQPQHSSKTRTTDTNQPRQ
jgi:hypothetical protein